MQEKNDLEESLTERTQVAVEQKDTPKYEEIVISKVEKQIRTDSYFDGKLLELIGWNILRLLITAVTLGIAGPWAECMLFRYKINHTILNGKRMNFVGNGVEYFVEKFKWIFFTIITLGIYSFWIPIKKKKWIISNIHFEDEEFIKDESYFDGKLIQLIGVNLLTLLLNTISLGILYPFTICFKLRWLSKHTIINRKKIVFAGRALNLFCHYLLWSFLTLITLGIYGLWLGIKIMKWQVKNTHLKVKGENVENDNPIITIIICIVVALIGIFIISNIIPLLGKFNVGDLLPQKTTVNDSIQAYR